MMNLSQRGKERKEKRVNAGKISKKNASQCEAFKVFMKDPYALAAVMATQLLPLGTIC